MRKSGEITGGDSTGTWAGLVWTPWIRFQQDGEPFKQLPMTPGVYRVRVVGTDRLAYIGQTGLSLRGRLRALSSNTLWDEMPWNDPHTAAPSLWAFRVEDGLGFECSVSPTSMAEPDRKCLESFLLWRYRLETGGSTLANFGRTHARYRKSRNRSTGDRGGKLPGGKTNSEMAPSLPPLPHVGDPVAENWMGFAWAPFARLNAEALRDVPDANGVYRILTERSRELLYVGETTGLRSRLSAHGNRDWGEGRLVFSWYELPEGTRKCQRLEVENDLLGGFFEKLGRAPRSQFGSHEQTGG